MQSNALESSIRTASQNCLLSRDVFSFFIIARRICRVLKPLGKLHMLYKMFYQNRNIFARICTFHRIWKL